MREEDKQQSGKSIQAGATRNLEKLAEQKNPQAPEILPKPPVVGKEVKSLRKPGSRLFAVLLFVLVMAVFLLALFLRLTPEGRSIDFFQVDGEELTDSVVSEHGLREEDERQEPTERTTGSADVGVGTGADVDAGVEADVDGVFGRKPPVSLPASARPVGYDQGTYTETWKAVSEDSCEELARALLMELRDSGMELVKADYLDLFGEAWGCTLKDGDEASITITLVPEEPFQQRSASNPLSITLIRTAVPKGYQ
jgi:hypothetical protein